jgi:hypothetical protein
MICIIKSCIPYYAFKFIELTQRNAQLLFGLALLDEINSQFVSAF